MSDQENDKDIDDNALAALVRPSAAPPADEEASASDDDDDDVLDLRALAASMAPPPSDPQEGEEGEDDEPEEEEDDEADASADSDDGEAAAAAPAKKSSAKKSSTKKTSAKTSGSKKGSNKKSSAKKSSSVAASSDDRRDSSRPPAAAPAPAAKGNGMWVGIAIGAAAVAAMAFFMNQGGDTPPATDVASGPPTSIEAPAVEGSADPAPVAEVPAPTPEPLAVAEAPVEPTNADPVATPAAPAAAPTRRAAPRAGGTTASAPAAAPTPEPRVEQRAEATMAAATMTADPAPGGGLDDVLNQALGGRPAAGGTRTVSAMQAPTIEPATTPAANLPATPSRGDVARTLGRLMAQIRQCAGDQVGLANATIMVRSDGTAASVSIGGHPFGGTPQGACMEGVLRRAQFPPFRQNTFRVNYPFAIRAVN